MLIRMVNASITLRDIWESINAYLAICKKHDICNDIMGDNLL